MGLAQEKRPYGLQRQGHGNGAARTLWSWAAAAVALDSDTEPQRLLLALLGCILVLVPALSLCPISPFGK